MQQRMFSLFPVMLLILGLLLVPSCKEDDHSAFPSVDLLSDNGNVSSDTSFKAGETMTFHIRAGNDGFKLTNFYIRVVSTTERTVFDTGINSAELDWEGSFIRGFEPDEQWTFVIRDRWGNRAETAILIGLDTASQFSPLLEKKDILLGAQNSSQSGSFYSLMADQEYFISQCASDTSIQKTIDLLYYFGPDLSTVASPGANIEAGIFEGDLSDWNFRNTTRFLPMGISASEFENFTNDSILIARYDDSLAKRKAKALTAGDTYVFKTQNGTLGMFLVKEVVEGEQGYVLLDLKTRER